MSGFPRLTVHFTALDLNDERVKSLAALLASEGGVELIDSARITAVLSGQEGLPAASRLVFLGQDGVDCREQLARFSCLLQRRGYVVHYRPEEAAPLP